MTMTCGEATIRLLARYGVTTVFGIPGVHTLEMCRGLSGGGNAGAVTHVQARNEQGAGAMAEGWARATGEVGVALVISGPGVTNAATALGQCHADSLPMLLISAEPPTESLGKGWGVLHEITEQRRVTEPLTGFSATCLRAADVPHYLARAFTLFASARPRPVHVSLPIDVQEEPVDEIWEPVTPPGRPMADRETLGEAARMLKAAERPVIVVGGGATGAAGSMTAIAEALAAPVIATTAGKGIVADAHPLSLSASLMRSGVQQRLAAADVVLAVGTELSETESWVGRLEVPGALIRVDIDAGKLADPYPATLGILGDAGPAMAGLAEALAGHAADRTAAEAEVAGIRAAIGAGLTPSERRHARALKAMAEAAPPGTVWSGDACQPVYTGAFAMDVAAPRRWFYPAGFCALGNALPNAIGAKYARPDAPVAVIAGDGGFMFTMPELLTAAEAGLPLPIVIWENGGLKQIRDDMEARGIPRVGVDGINPDFVALARACHCHGVAPTDEASFRAAFAAAFEADRPTLIVLREGEGWLA